MMGVDAKQISRWKAGQRKPSRASLHLMAVLCLIRVGGPRDLADLVHLAKRARTGVFVKYVDSYLEHEREVLARRAAKKAAKEAATSTKSSTTPDVTA